jgi:adenylate cyclase
MREGKGFIWRRSESVEDHAAEEHGETAMYMPLLWQGEVSGVICIDSSQLGARFTPDDLQLLATVAYWAAMAIANHRLQEDGRQQAKVLDRLLTNFSPNVRGKLLERARHGKLRPGGKKSEVTILYADIRGFTQMSADHDAEDIVDVLNTYFSPLIKSIFKYDGTIDKFIGDAILAVFGSPETDAAQHKKAVRAAWEMQAAVRTLNAQRKAQGLVTCDIGIGIHCGEVLHGFIGSTEQVEFTVIGDAVNRTSRYCDGANAGDILISSDVYQRVWEIVKEQRVRIETKHEGPLTAHRIKCLSE